MVFNSLHFVWFFVVVYALYRVLPHRAQNWLLLVASYYFYAAWDWRFLGLLVASTLVDYACGRALAASHTPATRRTCSAPASVQPHAPWFFKYFQLLRRQPVRVFGGLGWHLDFVTVRVLPAGGISFYTFVTMS